MAVSRQRKAEIQETHGRLAETIAKRRRTAREAEQAEKLMEAAVAPRLGLIDLLQKAGDTDRWIEKGDQHLGLSDIGAWADAVIAAADAWRTYYTVSGNGPLVSTAHGHEAAKVIFGLALDQCGYDFLVQHIQTVHSDLTKIGSEVGVDLGLGLDETAVGLATYFEGLAHAMARWDGELPAAWPLLLTQRVGPNARNESKPMKSVGEPWRVRTFDLDHEAMELRHVAGTCALRSIDRVTLLQALADMHGPVPGPHLEQATGLASVWGMVSRLEELDGFPEDVLAQGDRRKVGYRLQPGVRIVPTRARPFRLP